MAASFNTLLVKMSIVCLFAFWQQILVVVLQEIAMGYIGEYKYLLFAVCLFAFRCLDYLVTLSELAEGGVEWPHHLLLCS